MEPVKRRDMGIASLIIVVSQVVSTFSSSHSVSRDMDHFKEEFQRSQIEREEFFVRKTDITSLIGKLDHLNDQIVSMSEEIKSLKSVVRETYSLESYASSSFIVGCSTEEKRSPWKNLRL